ncbi:hypothetical protein FS837_009517 [Tulasnella sp. UAMH 9824]|nr:hypothetical protein FS837_009517 [Tulasnella sp. UAMH 9824]
MVNGSSPPSRALDTSRSTEEPSPVTSNARVGVDKISELPNELLATFLRLSLLEVDTTIPFLAHGVCRSYVMRLYTLRQVSASWRDVVDGTPNLWFIVSSTTPIDIAAVCLSRSKACPLLIHYGNNGAYGDYGDSEDSEAQEAMKEQESFLQFSQLTIPHRHRWAIVWLTAASDLVSDQLEGTMPLLHTVKLVSRRKTTALELNPATSSETPFGGDTKILRHVGLRGGPAAWGLARFSGLRTWKMDGLVGDGLTTQHILGVLRESPLLEVLEMERLKVQILPDDTVLAPVSLPRLTRITFRWCRGDFVNHILRHIQVPVELIEEFLIAVREWGSLQQIGLLTDGLSSWSPLLRRAHRTCNGSRFSVSSLRTLFWIARGSKKRFCLFFFGFDAVSGMQWIMDVLDQGDEPGPGVEIECRNSILHNVEAIGTFSTIKKITRLDAHICWDEESLQILFRVLGNPITPGFPWLENLKLQDWEWNTEAIMKMLQARFPHNGTGSTQLPELTIQAICSMPSWWLGDPPVQRQIMDFQEFTLAALGAKRGCWE